ncbi:PAS domain S-box protein [Candidatus Sumerlaeota bacterium]|nr:PAS domain S-box protein [Candidatus Sumerlaeota bacterium]
MKAEHKTKKQLIKEIQELRKRVAELEVSEAQLKQAKDTLYETNRMLTTLNAVSLAMASARTPEQLSEALAYELRRVMRVDAFFIDAYYPDSYKILSTGCFDTINGKFQRVSPVSGFFDREKSPIAESIFEDKEPVLIHRKPEEIELDADRFIRFGDTSRPSASLLYVPLVVGERVIGILSVQSYTFNAYTLQDVELLKAVARQIAPAVEGLLLHQQLIQSTAELRESQLRYQDLYESAPVAYFSVGRDGLIKRANKAAADFTGYSLEELQRMKVFDLYAEESKDKAKQLFAQFLKGKEWKNEEMVYRRKDGQKVYGLLSVNAIKDENGNVVERRSVVVDITKRKRAEIERQTFAQLGVQLVEADTLEAIAILLSQATDELFNWDAFFFAERLPHSNLFRRVYAVDTINGKRVAFKSTDNTPPPYPGLNQLLEGKPLILNRETEDMFPMSRFGDTSRLSWSLLFVPISFAGDVFGILSVQSYQPNRYGEQELGLLKSIADTVAPALRRVQAEIALREEKERAQKYLDVAGVMIVAVNAKGEVTLINKKGCEILGYSEEEIIGKNWFSNFLPQRLRSEVKSVFDKLMAGEIEPVEYFENPVLNKQGEERIIACHNTIIKDRENNIIGVLSSGEDITERRMAEEKLNHVHEIYRKAIENAQGVPYILNYATETYEFIGKGCDTLIGIPCSKLTRKDLETLQQEIIIADPEHSALPLNEYIDAFLRGEIERYRVDLKIITPQGEEKWLSDYSINIRDEKTGEATYSLGILQDITERKRIEEELIQRAKALERSNTELEQFAYIASHDLQEPLRKIQSFGDRLKDICFEELTEQGRDYLMRMLNATHRMRRLIQDLLAFSRVTTQGRQFVAVNLNKILQDVISDLEVQIQETGANVEVAELPTIDADPTLMRELFQNLIGNALKFRRPDVTPRVRVYSQPLLQNKDEEKIGAENVKYYQIFVEDNGIGFDEKYLDRIFLPFQRLYGRGKYEGTGIGLALCRKIVDCHNGQITAKSKPAQGTTFIVILPVHQHKGELYQ